MKLLTGQTNEHLKELCYDLDAHLNEGTIPDLDEKEQLLILVELINKLLRV